MPRLLVIQGVDEGRQFELTGPLLGIGRDSSNALHLHDTEISRRHAELRLSLDGATYRLIDRSSVNGVFVNGEPAKDALLRPGDQIQVGQTVMIFSGDPRPGDLAERIQMIARPDPGLEQSIVQTVDETEGSRIMTSPDDVKSPWLRTRLANLAILYEASQAISHIHDLDQLLDRLLELTFRSIEADRGCILLKNADTGALEPKAVRWRKPTGERDLAISRTITDYVLGQRTGILVSDAARDERFVAGQSILRTGIREAICVPMRARHETLGVLYLDTLSPAPRVGGKAEPKFAEDHLLLAIALAHQGALAVEDTRHYRSLLQAEQLAAVGQTIAALSHHIKNILQGLRSGSDILNAGINDKDDELLRQGWRIVEKNQKKIYDLVLDMLSFSKEREPNYEPADLNAVVADVAELIRSRADDAGVQLRMDLGTVPTLSADTEGIHRAVLNLAANALDAVTGRPDPKVQFRTSLSADGRWAEIAVIDNGVGIEPDQLGDLFKPFVSSKGARGTGLGLAVSRKTVREHGGDITVESTPEVGSTFTLRLPVAHGERGV